MRIAAICSRFPCLDETFILRELVALREAGIDLRILSLKSFGERIVHEAAVPLQASVEYLPWLCSAEVAHAAAWACARPRALLRILRFVLRGAARSPMETVKNLAILPKTFAFARRIEAWGPKGVHGFWATFPATAAFAVGELLSVPWSFSAHAHDIFGVNGLLIEKLRAAQLVLTCTEYNRRHLAALAPEAAPRILRQHHGLSLDCFRPAARTPGDGFRLLSVGTLLPNKGFAVLIRALAMLEPELDARLTIVGDGPERARLAALVSGLGLGDRVHFVGAQPHDALPAFYRGADAFVFPADAERHWGIPNVLLEALATGLPCVVTALPSLALLLRDGEEAILLPQCGEEERSHTVAGTLRRLAWDASLRRSLGEAGRALVEREFGAACTAQFVAALRRCGGEG